MSDTFADIAAWAASTIEGVAGYNRAWPYRRKVRTDAQLAADFGVTASGAPVLDDDKFQLTRGWLIDVKSRTVGPVVRGQADCEYTIEYICLWSLMDGGASATDFKTHVLTAAAVLSAEARPAALTALTASHGEIVFPADIREIYEVLWPLNGGRLHHRATLEQTVTLHETIRS